MTQQLLESLTYVIIPESFEYNECDDTDLLDEDEGIKEVQSPKHEEIKKDKNESHLIRKVEMILDHETDIHIYEDKYKIVVKKQTPFYISKKTWKLIMKKQKTINTASALTEI
jgi:hypothetical protein